jgi:hypothetical protein
MISRNVMLTYPSSDEDMSCVYFVSMVVWIFCALYILFFVEPDFRILTA